jgi:hypothetical protein
VNPWTTVDPSHFSDSVIGPGVGTWLNTTNLVQFRFKITEPQDQSTIAQVLYWIADSEHEPLTLPTDVGSTEIFRNKDSSQFISVNATGGGELNLTTGAYYVGIQTTNNLGIQGTTYYPFQVDDSAPVVTDVWPGAILSFHAPYFRSEIVLGAQFKCRDPDSLIQNTKNRFTVVPAGGSVGKDDIIPWVHTYPMNDFNEIQMDMMPYLGQKWSIVVDCLNHAGTHTLFYSAPFTVDPTPPICNEIELIDPRGVDTGPFSYQFTSYLDALLGDITCWDPESGVSLLEVGVGSFPGSDEFLKYRPIAANTTVVRVENIPERKRSAYFLNVRATNGVELITKAFSNRLFFTDMTPVCFSPIFRAKVGDLITDYSSVPDTLTADWSRATWDVDSGIKGYQILLAKHSDAQALLDQLSGPNGTLNSSYTWKDVARRTSDTFTHLSLEHNELYSFLLQVTNGAKLVTYCLSRTIKIDFTPPIPHRVAMGNPYFVYVDPLYDMAADVDYAAQWDMFTLYPRWNFTDDESPIDSYAVQVFDDLGIEVYPLTNVGYVNFVQIRMALVELHQYFVQVTAYNLAGLSAQMQSGGVFIDGTRPVIDFISMGAMQAPDGAITYVTDSSAVLEVEFGVYDFESGIGTIQWCIGD